MRRLLPPDPLEEGPWTEVQGPSVVPVGPRCPVVRPPLFCGRIQPGSVAASNRERRSGVVDPCGPRCAPGRRGRRGRCQPV